ncbi:hypothetical protein FOMG_08877 [Fusarium oxysporum f. sp. melonis 26406]|uniref:Xylose isomerase-like TIM barrel domain-containing protein n=1 Tax=Fusarium oxysporum f. sp. melonis 26406 TaxID=1089452 RepID=W9ZUZ5_FUSOX|nr:hypothetical protein FOMG_08877 [Fusarium oxysporum f. sp. melonis 26406]
MTRYPDSNKWAGTSVSLGKHPLQALERKLSAASDHGFYGVELVHSDFLSHAKSNSFTPIQSGQKVQSVCKELSIEVLGLEPLKNFEGNIGIPLSKRLDTAKEWIELAMAAGTTVIQMPSLFLPLSTRGYRIIIPELQELADLAKES